VIHYPDYQPPPGGLADLFASQAGARLLTVDGDGVPRVGLYPFLAWVDDRTVRAEVHLRHDDAQLADLARDPRCTLEVDEVLSYIPSHWQGDGSALHADLFYRYAAARGTAELSDAPAELARHLAALLARYQPEGLHEPVTTESGTYAPYLRRLVLVRFTSTEPAVAKFKLGQRASAAERERVAAGLQGGGEATARTLAAMLGDGSSRTSGS
jgi:predicted FMN-binding regulatory protein PaiB